MKRTNAGFTLIELLVSIAIIAILAGIAIPAYQNYVETSRVAKVQDNYSKAVSAVTAAAARAAAARVTGLDQNIPENVQEWIDLIDPDGTATLPTGTGPAFAAAADNDTGAIGIAFENDTVTITRPTYLTLGEIDPSTIDLGDY